MKFKPLLFVCFLAFLSSAYAGNNRHVHPETTSNAEQKQAQPLKKGAQTAGFCEIEIMNLNMHDRIRVSGRYNDGQRLQTFIAYPGETHYISLYYHGACDPGMYLSIDIEGLLFWYNIYSAYTYGGTTIYTDNYADQTKVKVTQK